MIRSLFLCQILLACTLIATAQDTRQYPGEHDYQDLDKLAEVLNFDEVRKEIGYPVAALKSQQELRVHCRVLVDADGKYVRHSFNRVDHPDLMGPIAVQLPNLAFVPAEQNHKQVSSWVNVPIIFEASPAPSSIRTHRNPLALFQFRARDQIQETAVEELNTKMASSNWEETLGLATQLIHKGQKKLIRKDKEALAQLYLARAEALLQLGLAEAAHLDLNDGLSLCMDIDDAMLQTRLRAMRVISWMVIESPEYHVEDYLYMEEEWQKKEAWAVWTALLESPALKEAMMLTSWRHEAEGLPEEIQGMISGLGLMAEHRFAEALPWLEVAGSYARPGVWQREIDLRIAECLRHLNQMETSLNQCQHVLESAPLDPFPHFVKGILLMDIGAYEDGTATLQKALALGLAGEARVQAEAWIDQSAAQMSALRSE